MRPKPRPTAKERYRDRVLAHRLREGKNAAPLIAADAVIVAYVELTVAIVSLEHRIQQLHEMIDRHLGVTPPRKVGRR